MPKKIVNPLINDTRLMQEWDWEKNGKENIFPDKIGIGSHKKVWWKCKKGHEIPAGTGKKIFWKCNVCGFEWEAVCSSRARGAGCPHCTKQKKRKNVTTLKHKD